ncbi:MAG: hypothetical protein HYT70_04020 [Candidatus Aenigmarchaeota archaeon]|nr:hypothetical protein [Candidatus Aenigmarchaeota archaeon]
MLKRINKSSLIGLFLIAVMILSTFAFAVLQAVYPRVELPKSNIIDYRLDRSVREAFLQNGATVITFEYSSICENCFNQKFTLESIAKQYEQQVFLEEILDESLNQSRLTMTSFYGSKELMEPTDQQITSALCLLMVSPPAECALLK